MSRIIRRIIDVYQAATLAYSAGRLAMDALHEMRAAGRPGK